jgi:ComF family protein
VLNIVYPKKIACIYCGVDLSRHRAYRYELCESCAHEVKWIKGRSCKYCGAPIPNQLETPYCYTCAVGEHALESCLACFEYGNVGKQLIMDYKYNQSTYLSRYFSQMLYDNIIALGKCDFDIIVPVPLHTSRRRERGFNHMQNISQMLADQLGVLSSETALRRVKATPRLKNLNKEARKKVLKGVFQACSDQVSGKRILLIDDIFTTGSTMNLCAKALLSAGASEVHGAVLSVNIKD